MARAKSLISNERECYFCKNPRCEVHHLYKSHKCRSNADSQGLWIYVCRDHHNKLHSDREFDLALMKFGQELFEKTHTRDEFRKLFNKSYL